MKNHWTDLLGGSRKYLPVGSLVIASIVLITYYPSLKVGFLGDDWEDVGKAIQSNLGEYLRSYFDPTAQLRWYRPLYGVSVLVQSIFFGANPDGYHMVQILLHLANAFLLGGIVWQLSKRWRLAWLTAALWVCFPSINDAVFWVAVHDPLAMFFYLTTVLFWLSFLQSGKLVYYLAAFAACIFALLAKEASVFVIVTLFLIDRLLVGQETTWRALLSRYLAFCILSFGYLLVELRVQSTSYFTAELGYGFGFHMVGNLLHYLAVMVFPWGLEEPAIYFILATVLVGMIVAGFQRQSKLLMFLGIQVVIAIFPVTGFPSNFFYPRYLYGATMVYSVVIALFLERAWQLIRNPKLRMALMTSLTSFILLLNVAVTNQAAEAKAEEGRQMRVPLRDIYQQHATYPTDTYLFFVEFPYPYILRNLRGMFYLRYGSNVSVFNDDPEFGGWDANHPVDFRAHAHSFVYYLDENKGRHEIPIQHDAVFKSSLPLPLTYKIPISLEAFELTSSSLERGREFALLLYWRAHSYIDRDYTVYVHLVDERGKNVLSDDSQPRRGRAPTSTWRPGKLVTDAHIIMIPREIAPGKYHLEVGLYDLATLERLWVSSDDGRMITDKIMIDPFTIVEQVAP